MNAPCYNGEPSDWPSVEVCDICGRELVGGQCHQTHYCDSCGEPTENSLDAEAELWCDRCAAARQARDEADAVAASCGLEPWEVVR